MWDQMGNVQVPRTNQTEIVAAEMDAVGINALGTILLMIAWMA